ncbi:SCP2 sterol-binding domain-containing protein [Amnimonas aquatica]|uniref:SCP-2 sterol transfer family protein n=1 Tax=Amnimonas aquatica TaxID=2094561 RepID=A0A2P6AU28_9GAMM|nr:SCP2 sterol-binding domain-containing protein [Amnimonas aquatica]PQA48925.1 SCP-2 sterol transfer family protein [Amnimonas aquatica]
MAAFLSQEWFAKVDELTAAAGDLNIPSSVAGLVLNVTVNGAPEGSVDLALNGGKFERGHNAGAATKLTLPADLLRKIFLEGDAAAGMQGFMTGQIKVEGDMSKLMTLQSARPSDAQKALFKQILALTA